MSSLERYLKAEFGDPAERKKEEQKQRVVKIVRGLPGSGKTYLANALVRDAQKKGLRAIRCSADTYFEVDGKYVFDVNKLQENHKKAQDAVDRLLALNDLEQKTDSGKTSEPPTFDPQAFDMDDPNWERVDPKTLKEREKKEEPYHLVVIDNTHVALWEMKPYVESALKHGYKVQFCEPETAWRRNPTQCAQKCTKGVPLHSIQRMSVKFVMGATVEAVLKSTPPTTFGPKDIA